MASSVLHSMRSMRHLSEGGADGGAACLALASHCDGHYDRLRTCQVASDGCQLLDSGSGTREACCTWCLLLAETACLYSS